jgi:dephospho-CoA kinase
LNIGISGPIGAGKTTAAKYIAHAYALSYLRYSEVLAEMSVGPPPNRQSLRQSGWEIMSHGLQSSVNQKLLSKIECNVDYVIDGLRHPIDYESLQNRPPFFLLYIDASPEIRWQRLKSRDELRTWEQFSRADTHPVESYLPILKEKAYKILQNEGSIPKFHAQLDATFQKIREQEKK